MPDACPAPVLPQSEPEPGCGINYVYHIQAAEPYRLKAYLSNQLLYGMKSRSMIRTAVEQIRLLASVCELGEGVNSIMPVLS